MPGFKGLLSHFTQPGQCFANEISDRLKVNAVWKAQYGAFRIFDAELSQNDWEKLHSMAKAGENDALMLFWAQEEDIKTALETIEERCQMAFDGVPNETRKSLPDGTTIFERVLPGADRMYPDTDSAPIPLKDEEIERMRAHIPEDIVDRYHQLKKWGVPEDTYTYIFSKNLFPLIQSIVSDLGVDPVFCATFFGHKLKHIEGQIKPTTSFSYKTMYAFVPLFKPTGAQTPTGRKDAAFHLSISQNGV